MCVSISWRGKCDYGILVFCLFWAWLWLVALLLQVQGIIAREICPSVPTKELGILVPERNFVTQMNPGVAPAGSATSSMPIVGTA